MTIKRQRGSLNQVRHAVALCASWSFLPTMEHANVPLSGLCAIRPCSMAPEKDHGAHLSVSEDLGNEISWQPEDSAELRYAGLVVEEQILDHAAFVFGTHFCKALTVESRAC